jgi:hypothetical protein
MAKTTFSEEIYLRALTGKVIAKSVLADYSKLAVISPKNIICSSLSAACEAVYSEITDAPAMHFTVESGNIQQTIDEVMEFQPDGILLMFGGETPIEETKKLFVDTLKALAQAEANADVIVHVRIFAAGGLHEAIKDKEIKSYLDEVAFASVYTFDLDNGKFVYSDALFTDTDEIILEKNFEIPITLEHADLLNRSLRDLTYEWHKA